MTPAPCVLPSAAGSAFVGVFATLLSVPNFDLGASANVDSPKLFSRSCIRGTLELVDFAGLPEVAVAGEMLGFSETVELTEGLGCRTVGVVDLVLDGSPDKWRLPPPGNDRVRLGGWLDALRIGVWPDRTGFDAGLGLIPDRDVVECLDVRLELGCP
jgi:hypothetical protein